VCYFKHGASNSQILFSLGTLAGHADVINNSTVKESTLWVLFKYIHASNSDDVANQLGQIMNSADRGSTQLTMTVNTGNSLPLPQYGQHSMKRLNVVVPVYNSAIHIALQ
jgi:hypothetical protein